MASQWFCRVLGQVVGPVSFRDLREMVRAGTLSEDDPVRRKESSRWAPAREVVGLFRAAEKPPAEVMPPERETEPEPTQAPSGSDDAARPAWIVTWAAVSHAACGVGVAARPRGVRGACRDRPAA